MKRFIIYTLVILAISPALIIAQTADESTLVNSLKIEKWIEKNAVEIQSIEPDSNDKDLLKLSPILKDKKIIGMGDATHGTKEFFVLKHKIIEYLIRNENCTAIALELPLHTGVPINNYVLTGEGDIDELLKKAWWWHKTEEIKDFLVWLKDYNTNPDNKKKVSFYGFDSQGFGNNVFQIFEYFKKVEPRFDEIIKPSYDFMAEYDFFNYASFTPYRKQKHDEIINKFKNILETNQDKYIAKSSKEEYLLTKARLNTFRANIEMNKENTSYMKARSEANIENIKYISKMQEPDSKIVVWAHNGHITSDEYIMQEFFNFDTKNGFYEINRQTKDILLGCMLREYFGDKYFTIGFEFNSGGFAALEARKVKEFTVDTPEKNTLPYLLNEAKVKSDCYFLELNKKKMDKDTYSYFRSVQFVHEIGAAYMSRYVKKIPITSYNSLIFIRNTTAVQMLDLK